eukprot:gene30889-40202_t
MKISIKTIKGDLFKVDTEPSDTIGVVKQKIQDTRSDLVADRQKLIQAGKILKDEQTISELVKKHQQAKPVEAPKPAPAAAPSVPAASSSGVTAPTPATAPTTSSLPLQPTPASVPPVGSSPGSSSLQSPEAVQALVSMGFPETESRAALSAAMGNPNLAYEFLINGIPAQALAQQQQPQPSVATPTPAPTAAGGIDQLRSHPQFNMLKRLLQENPGSLPQVLDLIGQQSPALLAAIHANNEAFITMMNEPIQESAAAATGAPAAAAVPSLGGPGGPAGLDAASMISMLGNLPPAQRAQFAQTLGMTPEQMESFMQMMSSMPPDALQSILSGAGGGAAGGRAGGPGQGNVIHLTHDEMEAVNRLVALGFSQQQAAQAFIACDRNETLAANLLFEGGWGDDDAVMGDAFEEGGHDDEDDMYH